MNNFSRGAEDTKIDEFIHYLDSVFYAEVQGILNGFASLVYSRGYLVVEIFKCLKNSGPSSLECRKILGYL